MIATKSSHREATQGVAVAIPSGLLQPMSHRLRNDKSDLMDVRQTAEYASFMTKLGWQVEYIDKTSIFIKKLPLLPPIVKILRGKPIDAEKIRKKYRPMRLVIQPFEFNAKPCNSPLVPTKTIWIDLTKSEKIFLSEMKQKTRYNLKQAQKNNLSLKIISGDKISPQELQDFFNLWKKNKPFDWLFQPSFHELDSLVKSFGEKCFFVFIWNLEFGIWNLIAGLIILQSDNMAFYWHNCSSLQAKKLFAPTLGAWEAIKESKKRRLKIFDFEGIWDERLPKMNLGWKGFTRFKEGFGGQPISLS